LYLKDIFGQIKSILGGLQDNEGEQRVSINSVHRQKNSISGNGSRFYGYCSDFISTIGLSRRGLLP
jgi:hypothetical protein